MNGLAFPARKEYHALEKVMKSRRRVNFRNLLCTAVLSAALCSLPACRADKKNQDSPSSLVRLDLLLDSNPVRPGNQPVLSGENAPAREAFPGMRALLEQEKETMQETTVSVVAVQVPAVRSCRVRIPDGGRLTGKVGLKAPGIEKEERPPIRFRIDLVTDAGAQKELFTFVENPSTPDLERIWQNFSIDLSGMAGRTVDLSFSAESVTPLPPGRRITAFWGNLILYGPVEKHSKPNIVVVSLDTLRADHLGCYGYPRDTSPFIDRLAKEGVLCSRVTANAPMTTPSHMSIMTSLYPQNHGVLAGRYRLARRVPTLAAVLAAGGYLTAAFTEGGNISSIHGFDLGFDLYWEKKCNDINLVLERALEWIEATPYRPFFLFLHTYQPHEPYRPHAEYTDGFYPGAGKKFPKGYPPGLFEVGKTPELDEEDLRVIEALYDGEIRYSDAALEKFYNALSRLGLAENTLFVVLSDHGEGFMEHQLMGHGNSLYEEALHIPLVFHMPGRIPGGRVFDDFAASIDIAPTILEIAGFAAPGLFSGKSLFPGFTGDTTVSERAFLLYLYPHRSVTFHETHALRSGRYKFILSTDPSKSPLLYDLREDPQETVNLAASRPDMVREMKSRLDALLERETFKGEPGTVTLDEEEKNRLEALGYLY